MNRQELPEEFDKEIRALKKEGDNLDSVYVELVVTACQSLYDEESGFTEFKNFHKKTLTSKG